MREKERCIDVKSFISVVNGKETSSDLRDDVSKKEDCILTL
jgi:hypothetical protein